MLDPQRYLCLSSNLVVQSLLGKQKYLTYCSLWRGWVYSAHLEKEKKNFYYEP